MILSILMVASAVPSATAEHLPPERYGPDDADLQDYLDCSKEASMRLLTFDEASRCTRVYNRIKLSFVSGVGPDDYESLSPQAKAAVNLDAYRRYLEWRLENPAEVDDPPNVPLSSSTLAEN